MRDEIYSVNPKYGIYFRKLMSNSNTVYFLYHESCERNHPVTKHDLLFVPCKLFFIMATECLYFCKSGCDNVRDLKVQISYLLLHYCNCEKIVS